MQDRFQFRVWKGLEKRMVYNVTYLNPLLLDPRISEEGKHNVVMQSLGFRDTYDKLAYEGDIFRIPCGKFYVAYCDKCKSFQCFYPKLGCYACEGDYSWSELIEDVADGEVEILGNIYENPELLEDE